MGKVFKAVTSILGFGSAPKARANPVSTATQKEEIADQSNTAKATRAALYGTEGGAVGEELDPNQVKRRPTLLGN
jgi:hypothetical protein